MLEYENITVNAIIQPILNNDLKEIRRHIKKATCKKIETDALDTHFHICYSDSSMDVVRY